MYDKYCAKCKTSLSEFYNTGMLGCPNCYNAFEREIIVALQKVQGRTFHVGKIPKISEADKQLISQYKTLIKDKEQASLDGRFSDMRRLSEEIVLLGEELKRRGLL